MGLKNDQKNALKRNKMYLINIKNCYNSSKKQYLWDFFFCFLLIMFHRLTKIIKI